MWKKLIVLVLVIIGAMFVIQFNRQRRIRAEYAFSRVEDAYRCIDDGNRFLHDGQIDHAITAYRKALEIRPNWDIALDNIAVAEREKNEYSAILDLACTNQIIYEKCGTRYLLEKKGMAIGVKRLESN